MVLERPPTEPIVVIQAGRRQYRIRRSEAERLDAYTEREVEDWIERGGVENQGYGKLYQGKLLLFRTGVAHVGIERRCAGDARCGQSLGLRADGLGVGVGEEVVGALFLGARGNPSQRGCSAL